MADHGARDHAFWSASSTARNWNCPGALAIQGEAPPDVESEHAARGTACHQISEKCLRSSVDAIVFLGETERTKTRSIVIDEELVNSAQAYVDYVRGRLNAYQANFGAGAQMWIEQQFSLAQLEPPFEAGGTGDAVLHFPAEGLLEIVDLKNGMGLVDVRGNPQLRTYGLGAVLKNDNLGVRTVRVTIVQPRVAHPDGRIRSEEFHIADLIEWTADLLAAMRRTKEAIAAFPGTGNAVMLDSWAAAWLKPGNCKFCRAASFCPALRQRAEEVAGIWFDDLDQPQIRNMPGLMSPEALARALDEVDTLEAWIAAVRGRAHTEAEQGVEIPNYQLVDKRGRRAWDGDDEKVTAGKLAAATKRPPADFYEMKLMSPAQADKLLGKKDKGLIESLWSTKSSGTNLVRTDKTTRPPAATAVSRHFEPSN